MNPNEQLGYISSSPLLVVSDEVKPIDEAEIGTIVQLFNLIQKQKQAYESTVSLDLSEELFTVKEQLYLNAESLRRAQSEEALLRATITKVREKQDEQRLY